MKNDFALALNEVLEDRGLTKEVVVEAIEAAMVSAYPSLRKRKLSMMFKMNGQRSN